MPYRSSFFFFHCHHCGEVYYSSHMIKSKKCLKCNKSFKITEDKITKLRITQDQAIKTIQYIKENRKKFYGQNYTKLLKQIKTELEK